MKKICTQLVFLAMVALIAVPVSVAGQNATNSTIVPVVNGTSAESLSTILINPNATTTTQVNLTDTLPPSTIASLASAMTEIVPSATPVTPVPTTSPVTQAASGNITVASSPLGAGILVDGVYYGVTPGNITGITAGNHIVRLTLSGYYDYEGTFSALPGQVTSVFGTLPPLSGSPARPSTIPATAAPVITSVPPATVQPTPASSGGALENPSVIAAIIGILTASIGAGATIFTHISKAKKE